MRLIDADKLMEHLEKVIKDNPSFVDVAHIMGMQEVVKEQPTAYDVDKVVEQLELTSKTALDLAIKRIPGFRFMAPSFRTLIDMCFEEAVRIVKAGGIDDKK